MSAHRYPWPALRGDYLRAGAGLALTGLPLATRPDSDIAITILAVLVALFAAFALRTVLKHASRYEGDGEALRRTILLPAGAPLAILGLGPRRVAWDELAELRLRFFSTRRDRTEGWMQLTLKSPGGRLSIESSIEGFDGIARRAAQAAARNGIALSDASAGNFAALGIAFELKEGRAAAVRGR